MLAALASSILTIASLTPSPIQQHRAQARPKLAPERAKGRQTTAFAAIPA
jgi:hypothetical protein